jgi:adenylate kinase
MLPSQALRPRTADLGSDLASRRVLVIGPPGAGKGTQCKILGDRYGAHHISTGELLREAIEAGTPLGRAAQHYVAAGFLVPDRLVLRLVNSRISSLTAEFESSVGFLLDGVPRTIHQAVALDALMVSGQIDTVIHLVVSDGVLFARLDARGRSDDDRGSVRRRLATYRKLTVPMLAWMAGTRPILTIDAERPIEDVTADVVCELSSLPFTQGCA